MEFARFEKPAYCYRYYQRGLKTTETFTSHALQCSCLVQETCYVLAVTNHVPTCVEMIAGR